MEVVLAGIVLLIGYAIVRNEAGGKLTDAAKRGEKTGINERIAEANRRDMDTTIEGSTADRKDKEAITDQTRQGEEKKAKADAAEKGDIYDQRQKMREEGIPFDTDDSPVIGGPVRTIPQGNREDWYPDQAPEPERPRGEYGGGSGPDRNYDPNLDDYT